MRIFICHYLYEQIHNRNLQQEVVRINNIICLKMNKTNSCKYV